MNKANDMNSPGILLVMTESPDSDEREFHDWYDLEHIPERAAIDGFLHLDRYVCLEGWPRYMALYDLKGLGVLTEPAYSAISGANFSPWSKRVIAGVRGWLRIEATQVTPGAAVTGEKGRPLRLAVLRIAGASAADELAAALGAFLSLQQGILQWRLFQTTAEFGGDHYVIVEFSAPVQLANLDWSGLALSSGEIVLANLYTRYWRREP